MKTDTVKRLALSGLLALSVTGGSLAPVVAGHASAAPMSDPVPPTFPVPLTSLK